MGFGLSELMVVEERSDHSVLEPNKLDKKLRVLYVVGLASVAARDREIARAADTLLEGRVPKHKEF